MPKLDSTLPENYRYEFRQYEKFRRWAWSYEIVGEHGSCQLHVEEYKDEEFSAGLEYHYRKPPEYMKNQPPSHDNCFLNKGPCWHDGTSFYAMDYYLPLHMQNCKDIIFRQMAHDADERFAEFIQKKDDL